MLRYLKFQQRIHCLFQPGLGHKLVFQGFVHGDGGIEAGTAHYRPVEVFKAVLAYVGRYLAAEAAGERIFMQDQHFGCFLNGFTTASLSQGCRLRKSIISMD
jgi:hypothetical protein